MIYEKPGVSGRSTWKTRLCCPWKTYLQGHLRMIKHNHYMDTHGQYMNAATIAFPKILFSHRCHSNLQDKIVRLLPVRHFICGIVTHQLGGTTCPSDKSVWKQTVAHDADKTTCQRLSTSGWHCFSSKKSSYIVYMLVI